MVIKGSARGSPGKLAAHLKRTDTNERMRVVEQRGVTAEDLTGALKEMDALGAALNTDRTLYHASMNTRADEHMTPAQWMTAIDRLEERLGLTGQPRVVVEHAKEGREHVHIVWSRTDLEHMRAIRCDHNFRTHEEVARELERQFGHAPVQGAHAERGGPDGEKNQRPDRTPSHAEMQQAERTGLRPQEAKAQITEIWQRTDSGPAFAAALDDAGWVLARGDKRDFVVVDQHGEAHSLARRVDGAKAADIRARMESIDRATLPTADEARQRQEERRVERERQPGPEAGQGPTQEPNAIPMPAPAASPNHLHVEPEPPLAARETPRDHGGQPPSNGPAMMGNDDLFSVFSDLASETIHNTIYMAKETAHEAQFVFDDLARRSSNNDQTNETLQQFAATEAERRKDEPAAREFSADELALNAAARRDYYAQQQDERDRNDALDRIGPAIKENRNLSREDVSSLTRDDLVNIAGRGDDHMRALCEAREREISRSHGDERER